MVVHKKEANKNLTKIHWIVFMLVVVGGVRFGGFLPDIPAVIKWITY